MPEVTRPSFPLIDPRLGGSWEVARPEVGLFRTIGRWSGASTKEKVRQTSSAMRSQGQNQAGAEYVQNLYVQSLYLLAHLTKRELWEGPAVVIMETSA